MEKVEKLTNKEKIVTDTVLYRKLALKSYLKFGDNAHLTVEDVFRAGRQADLVWAYYNLPAISFVDEILDSLEIQLKDRINKPGKNIELGDEILKRFETKSLEKGLVDQKDRFINHFIPKS